MQCLRDKHTGTPNSLDLLLRELAEELGLHNQRLLGQLTLAKHLVDALSRAWEESISFQQELARGRPWRGRRLGREGEGSQCAVNAPTAHQPEDAMHQCARHPHRAKPCGSPRAGGADYHGQASAYRTHAVNDGSLALGIVGVLRPRLLADKSPNLVQVHHRGEELLLGLVEVAHTDLTEVTRVILVPHDPVVVLATSVTATARVLPVLACEEMESPGVRESSRGNNGGGQRVAGRRAKGGRATAVLAVSFEEARVSVPTRP